MSHDEQLTPDRDLDLAMTVAGDISRVITASDTKIGFVLATQGVVVAAMTQSVRAGPVMSAASRIGSFAIMTLALITVVLLLAALWPRTGGAKPPWIAFTSFHASGLVPTRPKPTVLADAAWNQAAALSAIAQRKFRWFRWALIVGVVELASFVLWVTLSTSAASTT